RLLGFGGVALHHRHGIQNFGGDGAGVGHAVLGGAREAAHAPANPHTGQDHHHHHQQHHAHGVGVGPDQHHQRAQADHGVAQPHRQGRADNRLHQGGVGGQAREHFTALRG